MKKINIYKFKRNDRSNWLVLVNSEHIFVLIQGNDLFYQPKKWKQGYIIDGTELRFTDKHGFGVNYEGVNRKISRRHVKDFLNEFSGSLPDKVEQRIMEKYAIKHKAT